MLTSDPKQVIIDLLSAPSIPMPDMGTAPRRGWRGKISRGGFGAKATTMQFLKERIIPRRQVHAVRFEDEAGQNMYFTCHVVQDEDGEWHFRGGSGGSGTGIGCVREEPWANLGGGGWPSEFYAGGYVIDNGLDVTLVRLISSDGRMLEDRVEDGIVLFVADQSIHVPMQAELYSSSGELVGSHGLFH